MVSVTPFVATRFAKFPEFCNGEFRAHTRDSNALDPARC